MQNKLQQLFLSGLIVSLLLNCIACQKSDDKFLGKTYLLESESAVELYEIVQDLPIVDIHNHADLVEIIENKPWRDIWHVEGATDHYVWELMRKRGVPEKLIAGDASNKEKWMALAKVMPDFVGNPTYEWIHLDLKRRFQINETISENTAELIWNKTRLKLQDPKMLPQSLLDEMKIEVLCTTDDPTMHLSYHEQAQQDIKGTQIFPTWRPDKAMKIAHRDWKPFVIKMEQETGINTSQLPGFISALQATHDYFDKMGCLAGDHGVTIPYAYHVTMNQASKIHNKAIKDISLTEKEIADYQAYMLCQFGEMNAEKNWVMQWHIGPVRDYRNSLFDKIGPDSGGDLSTQIINFTDNMKCFLNKFDGKLKIVLYCMDPTHLPTLVGLSRAFPNVSLGAPWWFNDSPYGMETHFKYIGTVDLLRNHAGFVTDSRKLISFGSRTEMFRRSLCNVIGNMVEKGQMPMKEAQSLTRTLVYDRPLELFIASE